MADEFIRLAVVSDIHASIPTASGAQSYASTAPNTDSIERDAILSLEHLISKSELRADYLICCGDMADRANPTALNYIWGKFNRLAELLVATPIATIGNHDIDSRHVESDFDARGILRNLAPSFPLGDVTLNYELWSRNFVVLRQDGLRIIVLNSCAYHGTNPDPNAPEYLHGRISNFTLSDLRHELESDRDATKINILLCHHHPHKHQDIEQIDYSAMVGGEKLIDLLRESHLGPWMIVHGHKHHPRLIQGAGGARAPLVFGAGSLSAKLHADLQGAARNQFYILEFHREVASTLDLEVAGEIRAWDYRLGQGWVPAKRDSGLPRRSGFGYGIAQLRREARSIAEEVNRKGGLCLWPDLLKAFPQLRYVLPSDFDDLAHELKAHHMVTVIFDEYGTPMQFARSL